jgi:hypothetical protein
MREEMVRTILALEAAADSMSEMFVKAQRDSVYSENESRCRLGRLRDSEETVCQPKC